MTFVHKSRLVVCVLLAIVLWSAGCASSRVDWGSRIGSYSYDEAVLELGPPDKQARLTDGTLVADWIMRRGGYRRVGVGPYYYTHGYYTYAAYPSVTDYYVPDSFLRLTFNAEGNLTEWKKLAR